MLYNVIICYRYTLLYREISQKSNKRQDLKKAQDLKLGKSFKQNSFHSQEMRNDKNIFKIRIMLRKRVLKEREIRPFNESSSLF